LLVLAGGCAATEPYVYRAHEYDRESPSFNKEITDRESVTVCYNCLVSTDASVYAIATAECGRFGKGAEVDQERFGVCPLFVPIEARFRCVRR
jgi:hypothetical protein